MRCFGGKAIVDLVDPVRKLHKRNNIRKTREFAKCEKSAMEVVVIVSLRLDQAIRVLRALVAVLTAHHTLSKATPHFDRGPLIHLVPRSARFYLSKATQLKSD